MSSTPRKASPRRGSALVAGLAIFSSLAVLALVYLSSASDSKRSTQRQISEHSTVIAAESAISLAVQDVWGGFLAARGGADTSHWDFRFHMDDMGIRHQANPNPERVDLLERLDLARDDEGQVLIDGVTLEQLDVFRVDDVRDSRVTFRASVSSRHGRGGARSSANAARTVEHTYLVSAADFEGLDFALLANNVNCIMCHAEVDRAQRFYDPQSNPGRHQRVKIGSLESLHLREEPHSWIAGTLYLAGNGLRPDGDPIHNWGGLTLKSREFDADGFLRSDEWGDLYETNLRPADADDPQGFENLYLDYSTEDAVDGYMPDSFPAAFPDDGGFDPETGEPVEGAAGNRVVDPAEFFAEVSHSDGAISGGTISVLDPGDQITSQAGLDELFAGNATGLDAITEGTVVLIGTEDNPILLQGDVAIDGDVVLLGHVKGVGSIKSSGNVYMPGDVLYLDGESGGERTLGISGDGTENGLAVASGGNIMVGDIFRGEWGEEAPVTGDRDGGFNFIMDELAIFNRMEWMKTQPTLPGKTQKVHTGFREEEYWYQPKEKYPCTKYKWTYRWEFPNRPDGYKGRRIKDKRVSYKGTCKRNKGPKVKRTRKVKTYEWVPSEYENPHYRGEDYLPRYYGFTDDSLVPVFNKKGYYDPNTETWHSDERVGAWDKKRLTLADPRNPSDPLLYDADGNPKAVVSTLTASTGWITDELLHALMKRGLANRAGKGSLEIDATLYSNNSIFGVIPARNEEHLDGSMIVNGGIIAADVGLLAPTRLLLNYDPRGKELMDVRSDSQLTIRRELFAPARPGE